MTTYFTADPHYFHANIIRYCNRPFHDVQEMNEALIERWNSVVSFGDTVFVLGDVAMIGRNNRHKLAAVIERLRGDKHLIRGNHDRLRISDYIEMGFRTVNKNLLRVTEELGDVVLTHDPANAVVDRNKLFLVGHVHDLFLQYRNAFNVGVDVHNFTPVSAEQIAGMLKQQWMSARNVGKKE